LDPHAVEGHFIGYDEEAKGYRIYWLTKRTVTIERAVYIDKAAVASPGDVMFEGELPVPMQTPQSTTSNLTVNEPIENKCDNTPQSIPTGTPKPLKLLDQLSPVRRSPV
jgi:hypothetical protein